MFSFLGFEHFLDKWTNMLVIWKPGHQEDKSSLFCGWMGFLHLFKYSHLLYIKYIYIIIQKQLDWWFQISNIYMCIMGQFCMPELVFVFKKRIYGMFVKWMTKWNFRWCHEIFLNCAAGLQYTTTDFVYSDAVLSSPVSPPLLRGPAFCSLVLFVSLSRLNYVLPTARPLLLPPSSISYSSFLCWTKAQFSQP